MCSCTDGVLGCTKKACLPNKACGGIAGLTCIPTQFCAFVEGQLCGAADASATCQSRPDVCPASVDPVCGCDGKSYGSSCLAAAAGVGYRNTGACPR